MKTISFVTALVLGTAAAPAFAGNAGNANIIAPNNFGTAGTTGIIAPNNVFSTQSRVGTTATIKIKPLILRPAFRGQTR